MNYLITGGTGYIGSHTALSLIEAGHRVLVLDNLCNSSLESLRRVERISGVAIDFLQGDIRDRAGLDRVFVDHAIDAVIHFAGLKAVGESVDQPLAYYDNNVLGSVTLCQAMAAAGVFRLVFSSSATVYGEPAHMPIAETSPVGAPTNPYGRSKLMVEQILQDMADDQEMRALGLLRLTRAELSARLKAMPIEARGTCPVNKRPWKLPEMNADMMRYAILCAHRAGNCAGAASPC